VGGTGGDPQFRELAGVGTIDVVYESLQLTTGKYIAVVRVTDPSDCVVMASGQSQPFYVYEDYTIPEPGVYVPLVRWSMVA
jgi:hypothetical protein